MHITFSLLFFSLSIQAMNACLFLLCRIASLFSMINNNKRLSLLSHSPVCQHHQLHFKYCCRLSPNDKCVANFYHLTLVCCKRYWTWYCWFICFCRYWWTKILDAGPNQPTTSSPDTHGICKRALASSPIKRMWCPVSI